MFATLLHTIFISLVIAANTTPNPSFPINAPGRIMSPDQNVNRYRWIQRRARKRACTLSNPISGLIINPGSILTWQGLKNVATNVDRVDLVIAYMIMATVYLSYILITHIMDNVMHKNRNQKKEFSNIPLQRCDIGPKNNQVKEHKHKQPHVHTILNKCHKKDKKLLKKLLKRSRSMSKGHRTALLHAIIAYAKARKLNPNLRLKYCLKDILKHMGIPLHANHKNDRDTRNDFHEKYRKTIHIHLHHYRHHPKFDKSRHHGNYIASRPSKNQKESENTTNSESSRPEINEKPIDLQYKMTDELKQRIGAAMKKLQRSSPGIATTPDAMTT